MCVSIASSIARSLWGGLAMGRRVRGGEGARHPWYRGGRYIVMGIVGGASGRWMGKLIRWVLLIPLFWRELS